MYTDKHIAAQVHRMRCDQASYLIGFVHVIVHSQEQDPHQPQKFSDDRVGSYVFGSFKLTELCRVPPSRSVAGLFSSGMQNCPDPTRSLKVRSCIPAIAFDVGHPLSSLFGWTDSAVRHEVCAVSKLLHCIGHSNHAPVRHPPLHRRYLQDTQVSVSEPRPCINRAELFFTDPRVGKGLHVLGLLSS